MEKISDKSLLDYGFEKITKTGYKKTINNKTHTITNYSFYPDEPLYLYLRDNGFVKVTFIETIDSLINI